MEPGSTCDSVVINVWTDVHGQRCLEVVSNREMTLLEAKGMLHDAMYALVTTKEPVPAVSS